VLEQEGRLLCLRSWLPIRDIILASGDGDFNSPSVANGVVYASGGDNLYALDAGTGAFLWKYTTGNSIDSSPAVVNGMVYVGSGDGHLYAFGL